MEGGNLLFRRCIRRIYIGTVKNMNVLTVATFSPFRKECCRSELSSYTDVLYN